MNKEYKTQSKITKANILFQQEPCWIMIIYLLFRNCALQEKVEILFDSVNNSISLFSTKVKSLYLLVKNGNAAIGNNVINLDQSSINLLTPESINITGNTLKECVTNPKFKLDESYIQIEKNVDLSLREYINFNSKVDQKTLIRNNIYKCNFCIGE